MADWKIVKTPRYLHRSAVEKVCVVRLPGGRQPRVFTARVLCKERLG